MGKMLRICRYALAATAAGIALMLGGWTIYCSRAGFEYEYIRVFLTLLIAGVAVMAVFGAAVMYLRRRETVKKEKAKRLTPYFEREVPKKNLLRGAIIALAVLLIVLGIANGGLWDVLVKAINICTECIGLG